MHLSDAKSMLKADTDLSKNKERFVSSLRFNFVELLKELSETTVYRLTATLLLSCLLIVELYC